MHFLPFVEGKEEVKGKRKGKIGPDLTKWFSTFWALKSLGGVVVCDWTEPPVTQTAASTALIRRAFFMVAASGGA